MQEYIQFAPWLVVGLVFLWQNKVFVTPDQLSDKLKEERKDSDSKYQSKELCNSKHVQIDEMKIKIDKIYDYLMNKGGKS